MTTVKVVIQIDGKTEYVSTDKYSKELGWDIIKLVKNSLALAKFKITLNACPTEDPDNDKQN